VLDKAHRLRNLAEYDGDVDVDPEVVAAVIRVAGKISSALAALPPVGC
jgi:hypothetical protein